jgi:hypothetical protein
MSTKLEQAHEAWAAVAKPVTEASFVEWYMKTHNKKREKKRPLENSAAAAGPPPKKQTTLFGGVQTPTTSAAPVPAAATLSKGKRTALKKNIVKSLKAAIRGRKTKWHSGDSASYPGSTVCDPVEFAELFATPLTATGKVTHFDLGEEQLSEIFCKLLEGVSVATYSRPRSFRKAYKTGKEVLKIG